MVSGTFLVPIVERDGRVLAERGSPWVDGKCYAVPQQHQANVIYNTNRLQEIKIIGK